MHLIYRFVFFNKDSVPKSDCATDVESDLMLRKATGVYTVQFTLKLDTVQCTPYRNALDVYTVPYTPRRKASGSYGEPPQKCAECVQCTLRKKASDQDL